MARGFGWQLAGLGVAALVAAAVPAAAQQSTTREMKQDTRKTGQKAEQATESRTGQSGAAAAASPAGQDAGRTAEKRNGASGTLSDAWLTAKTKLALLADEQVGGMSINVDTRGGVVTLKGEVKSEAEKQKAIELARKTDGVKEVRDQLVVKAESETRTAGRDRPAGQSGAAPGASGTQRAARDDDRIAQEVRQAIQQQWRGGQLRLDGDTLKGARDTEIEVKVDEGVVTLEGKVPDVQDIVQAAQAARGVQGVRAVKTNVESGRPS